MSPAPLRTCLGLPGKPCGRLSTKNRCESCRRAKAKDYDREHRALRQQVLERDGYKCQCSGCSCCLPRWGTGTGCAEPATAADHVVPLDRGGQKALSNYQAMCGPCNSAKRNR